MCSASRLLVGPAAWLQQGGVGTSAPSGSVPELHLTPCAKRSRARRGVRVGRLKAGRTVQ